MNVGNARSALTSSKGHGASTLRAISRHSLKDEVVERIREAIERGELKSGEQIKELGLAHLLGVAQPTIREALLELEFIGFIERQGPRKTCITSLSRRQIDDIYLVRSRLETLVVEILTERRTADLSHCQKHADRLCAAAQDGKLTEFYQADLAFHRALWQATENESLIRSLEGIVPKLFAFGIIRQNGPDRGKLIEMAGLHQQLLDLIPTGNVEAASRLMKSSMDNAWVEDALLPESE